MIVFELIQMKDESLHGLRGVQRQFQKAT